MTSPNPSDEDHLSIDPAQPFKGIVVCCTSIPPEYRTEIAQKVIDLGGVHRYDLTPDVTHLIVGDYDTPKYRHVARERQDIRAMDASWVDAISELWKDDEHIDFLKLEKEHQLLALEQRGSLPQAGSREPPGRQPLLICLTGFGYQRDEIVEKIIAHGGKHTDDLTRRCTHLIVNKPEGKKFTAAKSWNIRTVTMDWLDQSTARGMILAEDRFDPLLPPDEQGVGAWIKKDPRRRSLGKRSRSGASGAPEEGARKLRKTASMKLNSQRNNLWGDILGRADSREYSFAQEHQTEEPVKQEKQANSPVSQPRPTHVPGGVFDGCIFYIHGFSSQRTGVLTQTIQSLEGMVASTLSEAANSGIGQKFLIVPQSSQPDEHPQLPNETIHVVTEFYIEKCLHNKTFFNPTEGHALGRPFPLFPIPGFHDLTICTAAFTGIELSQVARSVAQLGARFEEQFRKTTSVLVCKSLDSMRKEKLRAAITWGVPVVTADWLWECISTGYNVPVDDFIYPEVKDRLQKKSSPAQEGATGPQEGPSDAGAAQGAPSKLHARTSKPSKASGVDPTAFDHDSPSKKSGANSKAKPRRVPFPPEDSTFSNDFNTARTQPAPQSIDPPLTELSSASLNKSPSPPKSVATSGNHPAARTKSDPTHDKQKPATSEEDEVQKRAAAKAAERQALTSKLTTLLDSTATSAGAGAATADDEEHNNPGSHPAQPRPRKRQILGRAISNVSAGSSAASAPAAAGTTVAKDGHLEDGDEDAAQAGEPQLTQIGYLDPEAQDHKAALMDRMMGGSGDVGKSRKGSSSSHNLRTASTPAASSSGVGVGVVAGGTRSLRRR